MNIKDIYKDYYDYMSIRLKPTTLLHNNRIFNNYILKYFDNYNVDELNIHIFIDFYKELQELKYSNSFYRNINTCLKDFFNYLSFMYKIDNLSVMLNLIKINKAETKKLNVWNIHEYNQFINKVDDPIYHALFNTLFFTGIRKGEALALRFSDLVDDELSINKTITKELFNGKRLETEPKTKKSIRNILIDHKLKNEILKLQRYYTTLYDNYNSNFYIFGGNKPIATTTLERKKDKYVRLAGVKNIRIHDFRHSHATMLYDNHVDIKLIQERLGHADISTTLNVYVHTEEKQEKRLIRKINLLRL